MLSILRDGIWQFIGAILALIGVGFSIYLYFVQKNRKSLSCRLLAETQLFRHVNGKFQTTYEGRPVQNVFLIIVKVLNDGNVPILVADFEQPLTFALGSGAHVLTAESIHTAPEGLSPTLRTTHSSVTVEPLLLNSKDEFDVKILCDGYDRSIDIKTRIVGVREVTFFKSSTQKEILIKTPEVTPRVVGVMLSLAVGLLLLMAIIEGPRVALAGLVTSLILTAILSLLFKKFVLQR
jgi:hypothetical protein